MTQPNATQPLDRSQRPAIPASVTDLWDGWDFHGLPAEGAGDRVAPLGVALRGITSVVNAMAGGDHFRVGLSGSGTAWTDLKAKMVNVTSAALADGRLTLDEALAVTTAMAIHEAGHGRITGPMDRAVSRRWPGQGSEAQMAHRLSNIVEDVRLEADTARLWPAYGDLFAVACWWVAQRYPSGTISRVPASQAEAANMAVAAIRYDVHTTWSADPAVQAERAWWQQWGQHAATLNKPKDHVAAIEDAMARLANLPEQAPQPAGPEPTPAPLGDEDGDDLFGEPGDPFQMDEQPDVADANDDPDGHSPWGDEDEDDEQSDGEGGDEPLDADGLPGEADGPTDEGEADGEGSGEAKGDSEGNPSTGAEADPDGPMGQPDDGAHTEGGEVTYHHGDEAQSSEDEAEREAAGDDVVYGPTDGKDWDPNGQRTLPDEGSDEPERDALSDPLPAHATDAVTSDDRDRDMVLADALTRADRPQGETTRVTHYGGHGNSPTSPHSVLVGTTRLETERTGIATNPAVQGALRAAFTSRRTARDNRDVARSGRISGSRAYRVRAGFDNVFTRRDSLSPDRLDLHLLVDASGSMGTPASGGYGRYPGPKRVTLASQMAANITEALAHLPYVRVHVWAHNTVNGTTLWDVYDSRRGEKVGRMAGIRAAAANNDASAIAALSSRIVNERSARETSVMVVVSDGAPCEDEAWVRGAVENARKQKVGVMSVAITGGLTTTQEACYGADWVVPWNGDWDDLSRNIARMVGRLG
jgi:hypothetical protein